MLAAEPVHAASPSPNGYFGLYNMYQSFMRFADLSRFMAPLPKKDQTDVTLSELGKTKPSTDSATADESSTESRTVEARSNQSNEIGTQIASLQNQPANILERTQTAAEPASGERSESVSSIPGHDFDAVPELQDSKSVPLASLTPSDELLGRGDLDYPDEYMDRMLDAKPIKMRLTAYAARPCRYDPTGGANNSPSLLRPGEHTIEHPKHRLVLLAATQYGDTKHGTGTADFFGCKIKIDTTSLPKAIREALSKKEVEPEFFVGDHYASTEHGMKLDLSHMCIPGLSEHTYYNVRVQRISCPGIEEYYPPKLKALVRLRKAREARLAALREKERVEREARLAKEKALKAERLAKQQAEKAERLAKEKAEKAEKAERLAKEKAEKEERLAKEKAEKAELQAKEQAEHPDEKSAEPEEKTSLKHSEEKVAGHQETKQTARLENKRAENRAQRRHERRHRRRRHRRSDYEGLWYSYSDVSHSVGG